MTKQANFRHIFLSLSLSISIPIKANLKVDSIDSRKERKKGKGNQDDPYMKSSPSPQQSICKQSPVAPQMKRTPWTLRTDRTRTLTRNKGISQDIHQDTWRPTSRGPSDGSPSGSTYCLDCGTTRERPDHTADLCQAACQ